jgi:hypothetical protein
MVCVAMPFPFITRRGRDRGVAAPRSQQHKGVSRNFPDFNQMLTDNQRRWRNEALTLEAVERGALSENM